MTQDIVWTPSPDRIEQSQLLRFARKVLPQPHSPPPSPADLLATLHLRAAADPAWFWHHVLQDLNLHWHTPYSQILDLSHGMPFAKWCINGRMNIVDSCLTKWLPTPNASQPALLWEGEDGTTQCLTYADLATQVRHATAGLRRLGIAPGDVVGVFMPMVPEIVVAMLAIIAAGAIFLPLFSGYGPDPIATRLNDASAKLLLTADGFSRRGKWVDMKTVADAALARVPSVTQLVILQRTPNSPPLTSPREHPWSVLTLPSGDGQTHDASAEDPMMLIYTSGTTGKPKGAVHTHCGFPLKSAADMLHGFDIRPADRIFWVTDMGWMMGPWLVFGSLLLGATMVLYDGALDHPSPSRLWDLTSRHHVTLLGVSPTLIRAMMKSPPPDPALLASVTAFGSTGEPWNPAPWHWLFDTVGHRTRPILNYSGGTEISGGILCGNVCSPLKPCSFAGPMPGMVAEVWDESGHPVTNQVGELVLRAPWIGMTRGFWNDPQRYLDTYFHRSPDVWIHGDFATVDSDGHWFITGRSDDTLKIAGKRLGPAEVEGLLVGTSGIAEAVAIGIPDDTKGEALVCFCTLRPNTPESEQLRSDLRDVIIRELGKPLAPKSIHFLRELPRTRNGKIMRRLLR